MAHLCYAFNRILHEGSLVCSHVRVLEYLVGSRMKNNKLCYLVYPIPSVLYIRSTVGWEAFYNVVYARGCYFMTKICGIGCTYHFVPQNLLEYYEVGPETI